MMRAGAKRLRRALLRGLWIVVGVSNPHPVWADKGPKVLWHDARLSREPGTGAIEKVVGDKRPAVLQVRGRGEKGKSGGLSIGTGFFINASGYILTNEHVISEAEAITVRLFDGRELSACVVGADALTDIALLRARVPGPVPYLRLGDSRRVRVGQAAIVIGNPFGFAYSVSAGIVSATERVLSHNPENQEDASYSFYLQTDAAINLGNSGGPLFNTHGDVIGVASAFWGGGHPAQGIGFAIPIHVVKTLLPRLANEGRIVRSFAGVESQVIDPKLGKAFGLGSLRGALLAYVTPGGPAATAGLLAGDVITHWGDMPVAGVEDLKIYVQLTPPGRKVPVRYLRDRTSARTRLVTEAQVGGRGVPHAAACRIAPNENLPLGWRLAALGSKAMASLPQGAGVRVEKVSQGSALDAGILPGDIVLRVGAQSAKSPAMLAELLSEGPREQPKAVLVRRDGVDFWVAMQSP